MEKPHKKLKAWQLAMEIAQDIYRITQQLPAEEKYGLLSQMRRSATSIPSNIAEGAARQSSKEFVQFLHIAQASLAELDTQCELCCRLEYLVHEKDALEQKLLETDKVLSGLIRSLKSKSSPLS